MKIVESTGREGVYLFYCPGCKCGHWFSTSGQTPSCSEPTGPKWTWNGDVEKPTICASILVKRYDEKLEKMIVCHSFITDGMIQFLPDSTHELSGQTVPLESFTGD